MKQNQLDYQEEINREQINTHFVRYEARSGEKALAEQPYQDFPCACTPCQGGSALGDEVQGDLSMQSTISQLVNYYEILQHKDNDAAMEAVGEFSLFLQKLLPRSKNVKCLNLNIMDTVFFQNKNAYMLIYNQTDEFSLQVIRQRERLSQFYIRNFFSKRRFEYLSHIKVAEQEKSLSPSATTTKNGLSHQSSKLLVDANSVLKNIKLSKQLASPETQYVFVQFAKNNEQQIMCQSDFNFLMESRKNDPIWQRIQFIQLCLVEKSKLFRVKFRFDADKTDPLFGRAKEYI